MRISILLLFLALAATPAAAQLTIEGIPWGTPPEQVRARLEARGWFFHGVDQNGEHVFGRGDGAELVATFGRQGVREIHVTWYEPPAAAQRRVRAMADSLRRVLGRPRTDAFQMTSTWMRGDTAVEVWFYDGRPREYPSHADLTASLAEPEESRGSAAADTFVSTTLPPRDELVEGDWGYLAGRQHDMILLDTATVARMGADVYRARYRREWLPARRMMDGRWYHGVVWEREVDCAALRWRTLREIPFLDFQRVTVVETERRATSLGWISPPAESLDGQALRASCPRLARRAGGR